MNAIQGAQRQRLSRRVLAVRFGTIAAITLLAFALHDWFHEDLAAYLGLSHRLAHTLGIFVVLILFIGLQRLIF